MSIKQQIAAMPTPKLGYFVWQAPNEELDGGFRPEDLKALADSHTRLIRAVRGIEGITKSKDWDELDAAIEEAEKL